MTSSPRAADSAPVELRPASVGRMKLWMRALFRRGAPRARMVAPKQVRLGATLAVEWGVDCPAGDLVRVSVKLVGLEIARQRLSARTGITVVSQSSAFAIVELARATGEPDQRVVYGRGTTTVPARTITSFAGAYNEVAWAIVVEADFVGAPSLRESFPIVVLPRNE